MRLLVIALASALIIPGLAQSGGSGSELAAILSFETEHRGNSPGGWGGGPAGTIVVDGQIVHGGRWSARLERDTASPSGFSTITKSVPMDFAGTRIEWRGFLRAENVSEYVGLWMREDGDTAGLAFDNMQQRQVKGTHDWTEYSITLPVHRDAKQLYFGVLIAGTGKLWADDLQLLVDGKPIWEAPRIERAATAIDLDHEFDGGSHIVLDRLSAAQIENLTRFTYADLDNPGAFRWRGETPTLSPQPPLYSGKIAILVDEVSQSQAEHTAMALRSARQAMVVGSTTAGADGNVSPIPLPGGLRTMISGIGVFYPDKRPTQRVGIVPDVEVRPTIAGIRAGRDEVLDEAMRQVK